jgi:hypothetical protein
MPGKEKLIIKRYMLIHDQNEICLAAGVGSVGV